MMNFQKRREKGFNAIFKQQIANTTRHWAIERDNSYPLYSFIYSFLLWKQGIQNPGNISGTIIIWNVNSKISISLVKFPPSKIASGIDTKMDKTVHLGAGWWWLSPFRYKLVCVGFHRPYVLVCHKKDPQKDRSPHLFYLHHEVLIWRYFRSFYFYCYVDNTFVTWPLDSVY